MSVVLPMGNTWTRKSKVLFWLSFAGYGASWSEEFLACGWAATVWERSDVESQESCGHLILGDTLFPCSFSSFSASIKGTDKHTENGHKYGYKSSGFHVSLLRTVYTQDSDGKTPALSSPKTQSTH